LGNWAGLAALVGVTGIAYARIHVEASALVEVLRAPYKEYRQRTARINALRVLAKLASRERGARYKSKLSAASLDL